MSLSADEFAISGYDSPEEADALLAMPKPQRAKKHGRTFTPSIHSRPLPGKPGAPLRGNDSEERATCS